MTHFNLRRVVILGVLSAAALASASAATIYVTPYSLYSMINNGEDEQPGTPALLTVTREGMSVADNLAVSAQDATTILLPQFSWSSGSASYNADALYQMLYGETVATDVASVTTPLSLNLASPNLSGPSAGSSDPPTLTGASIGSAPSSLSGAVLTGGSLAGDPPAATPEPASFAFLSVVFAGMLAFYSRSKRQRLND